MATYTLRQYEQRLSELAISQRRVVKEEAETAHRLAAEDNFDAAAEHVQLAIQAEAQAGSYDHARDLLRQMGLVQ